MEVRNKEIECRTLQAMALRCAVRMSWLTVQKKVAVSSSSERVKQGPQLAMILETLSRPLGRMETSITRLIARKKSILVKVFGELHFNILILVLLYWLPVISRILHSFFKNAGMQFCGSLYIIVVRSAICNYLFASLSAHCSCFDQTFSFSFWFS